MTPRPVLAATVPSAGTAPWLSSVGLDQLDALAALQSRVDRKYLLDPDSAAQFIAALPGGTRVLDIDGRRDFGYESVYFDTPQHAAYLLAARKRRLRWKVRTRVYTDTDERFVEVKTRRAAMTVKVRQPHDGPLTSLGTDDLRFVADSLAPVCGQTVDPGALVPSLHTAYRRTTFLLPGAEARLTVDSDLGWASFAGENAPAEAVERPHLVVVETKAGRTPSSADRLLWSLGHRPTKISKFGTGLAALTDLPATKWRRVLRTHFPGAPLPAR